ncbi:MAG: hypothetical protein ACLQNE_29600 [Thermoguttaceae bacterium]
MRDQPDVAGGADDPAKDLCGRGGITIAAAAGTVLGRPAGIAGGPAGGAAGGTAADDVRGGKPDAAPRFGGKTPFEPAAASVAGGPKPTGITMGGAPAGTVTPGGAAKLDPDMPLGGEMTGPAEAGTTGGGARSFSCGTSSGTQKRPLQLGQSA